MNLINWLKEIIIPVVVSSGVTIAILKALGESFLQNLVQKDLQKHKTELQEKTEVLKTSLSIYAKEQDIAYQRVDTQRANAIHSIYNCICDSSMLISQIISEYNHKTKIESIEKLSDYYLNKSLEIYESTTKMNTTLRENAIYFNNETYIMINEYFNISATLSVSMQEHLTTNDSALTTQNIECMRKVMETTFHNKLAPLHNKIINCFRYILGIENAEQYKQISQGIKL